MGTTFVEDLLVTVASNNQCPHFNFSTLRPPTIFLMINLSSITTQIITLHALTVCFYFVLIGSVQPRISHSHSLFTVLNNSPDRGINRRDKQQDCYDSPTAKGKDSGTCDFLEYPRVEMADTIVCAKKLKRTNV
jgi:hypothetical protein